MTRILYPIHTEPVSTSPETVTESRWHQPWSEPVRRAQVAAQAASGGIFVPVVVTATPTVFNPLAEPGRVVSRVAVESPAVLPAPTKGWYVGANLADAPAGTAYILDNMFPQLDYVRVRRGSIPL